ncbi:Integrase catalytic domain-containing protein [Citrus sinensis]|uniref:Integrase catalytic domain-containing protein n=1 Tax=Citrus sinensis TaxID=2711 RepID=A0ACB8ID15_CITSI|nr:Integrase catalytic domain-containing protein [Citrus sinensis]
MTSTKVDLEKFNGKNDFNMWKVNMEAVLITHGLGDALLPITKKEGKDVSTSKTPEQMAEIDRKAKGTIILSLADSVIREVAKEPTVADLWAKLESIYMKKSLANRLYIKKRMFTLKMHEGSSLDEHLDEFNKVCDTLETIDAALEDEDKALLLISSLPKSYEHFIDALMYGRQTLSLDEVKSALSTKELQGKQESLGNSSGKGLTVKAKPEWKKKKQGNNKEKKKNLRCFLCHKEGHFKKDCPEKKFQKKGKGW